MRPVIAFEEDERLQKGLGIVAETHNFKMEDHQLEIQGICEASVTSAV